MLLFIDCVRNRTPVEKGVEMPDLEKLNLVPSFSDSFWSGVLFCFLFFWESGDFNHILQLKMVALVLVVIVPS